MKSSQRTKRILIAVIVILLIAIDLCVMLYPKISGYVNSQNQTRAVIQYFDEVAGMGEENMKALLDAAREYNRNLLANPNRFRMSLEEEADYKKQLDTGRGVIGTLLIDKIDVKLPIYHGTDEGVLQVGLGHLQGSSLPVGGDGTHSFITGHRGLPSSTLLSDLDKMETGDTFALYVLGEMLVYQVDKIQTVEPSEVEALNIERDMDYCTLVTCTPYGINTHRLLVRGQRLENAGNLGWETLYRDARMLDKINLILIALAILLPVLVVYIIVRCRKIYKGEIVQ